MAPSSCWTLAGIVAGAQNQIELGTEIADRLVVASQLLCGRQRAQSFADFTERAFDAGQHGCVGAALAGVVDTAGQRADFGLDRFDRPARHRLGNGATNLGQFVAKRSDRLLDPVGTLQRFDLAGDIDQMTLERRKIRNRWRDGRRRLGRSVIKFVLAGSDFRDREVERLRAERRGRTIDLSGRALDQVGLALRVLKLGLFCGGGV